MIEYLIVASRGRSKGDWSESEHFQNLEINRTGATNSITSVAKDNYVLELYETRKDRQGDSGYEPDS
jgi:hypothetical protein